MKSFKDVFNEWLSEKSNHYVYKIDKICSDLDIDPSIWFNNRFRKNMPDYDGNNIFEGMLDDFIGHIDSEFENSLLKYLPPRGYNIYREPYICVDYTLEYKKGKFRIAKNGRREWKKELKRLTLNQRAELMEENKLFSQIVTQTKLKIFSKKDIRVLKLKKLNEYSGHI